MEFIGTLFYLVIFYAIIKRFVNLKKFLPKNFAFSNYSDNINKGVLMISKLAIPVVIVLIGLFVLIKSLIVIPAGTTGVYEIFGKVSDTELHSGMNLVNPLGSVTKLSIRTEEYTMSIASEEGMYYGDDSITALTNEGLEVKLDLTVLYRLAEDKASDIYRTVGLDYVEKIVRPSIRSIIREEISQFSAKEIYSEKRGKFSQSIQAKLSEDLDKRGLILEDVLLRNVLLPDKLAQSIQDKLTAEQESQRYDFVLEKETKEAERKRIEAAGQRDSQKIINEGLTDKYLEYLYINSLQDRQGTIYVPTSPDSGLPLFKSLP